MEKDLIIDIVNRAIDLLDKEFSDNPTLFFTEQDVVSRLYSLIQQGLGYLCVSGSENNMLYLVHHEYPTPFKCNMKNNEFEVMDDSSNYRRGHYDIVVFNPDFLKFADYELVRGQDYSIIRRYLPDILDEFGDSPILIGIEVMHNRRPFLSDSRVSRWVQRTEQDCAKLAESRTWKGRKFMQETQMLFFTKYQSPDIKLTLSKGRFREMIRYIAPK